jgi:hypothetical protein
MTAGATAEGGPVDEGLPIGETRPDVPDMRPADR